MDASSKRTFSHSRIRWIAIAITAWAWVIEIVVLTEFRGQRAIEFSLFQDAETGDYSDDQGNLYNVHKNDDEFVEIGTKHELLAIFWKPPPLLNGMAILFGQSRLGSRLTARMRRTDRLNRSCRKWLSAGRMSQRAADRILRDDHP